MQPFADDPLGWLELELLDRDLYRGINEVPPGERPHIYGGQVAAQALLAASYTVADDRLPHSLHGYFLRPGDLTRPVLFSVDRDRDGRSFSARRVAAIQGGEVIFEMSASFHVPEDGAEYTVSIRTDVPPPEALFRSDLSDKHRSCEMYITTGEVPCRECGEYPIDAMWCRVVEPYERTPILDACMITFMSDFGSGFGAVHHLGMAMYGPSIDHSVWFHSRVDPTDWLLFDCTPLKVGGSRGLYQGAVHDRAGNLAAMFTQEMLLRQR